MADGSDGDPQLRAARDKARMDVMEVVWRFAA